MVMSMMMSMMLVIMLWPYALHIVTLILLLEYKMNDFFQSQFVFDVRAMRIRVVAHGATFVDITYTKTTQTFDFNNNNNKNR